ncbi:hypothetical protein [Bacteroides cellulosilyticus]|uniref:hypothetical protein n=1 Tax=Bacteroides cellulosilyticus TaxID=246787 RepID=UPI003569A0CC
MGGEEFADTQLVHDTAGQGKVGESITVDIVIGEEAVGQGDVSGNGVVKGVKVAFGRVQSGAGQTNKETGQQATAE